MAEHAGTERGSGKMKVGKLLFYLGGERYTQPWSELSSKLPRVATRYVARPQLQALRPSCELVLTLLTSRKRTHHTRGVSERFRLSAAALPLLRAEPNFERAAA